MRTGKVLTGLILIAGSGLAALVSVPAAAQDTGAMRQVGMVRTGEGTFTIDVAGATSRFFATSHADPDHCLPNRSHN